MTEKKVYKIVFVGDSYVGKSTIIGKMINPYHKFRDDVASTVGGCFNYKTVNICDDAECKHNDKCSVILELVDTAGQERYFSLTSNYFRNASLIFVVFEWSDIINDTEISFKKALDFIAYAENQNTGENYKYFLIGNKLDLVPEKSHNNSYSGKRKKFIEWAKDFNLTHNNRLLHYLDISAKTNENFESFLSDIKNIIQKNLATPRINNKSITIQKEPRICSKGYLPDCGCKIA